MADLFRGSNKHGPGMGTPPHFDGDDAGRYYGFFENEHREQFVFRYDYEKQSGALWLGDAGWEQSFEVVDGEAGEVTLGLNEQVWLKTCWHTAIAFSG